MKRIDDVVHIDAERTHELLKQLDVIVRAKPSVDALQRMRELIDSGLCKTQDELIFLSFMFGSCDGTKRTIEMMEFVHKLNPSPEDISVTKQTIEKKLDDQFGEE